MKQNQKYGLPSLKKYPMPDSNHVRSAIRFFNYVDQTYEKELARAIIKRMKEYGLTFDDFTVGPENRFRKYIPKNELKHHGIKGQRWGIRRYQNPDGSLTEAGIARRDKKDLKWLDKREKKLWTKAYKKSQKELDEYVKNDLNKRYTTIGKRYINEYNAKAAEVMNKNVGTIPAPSGRVVRFVAKRGEVGVYTALADPNDNLDYLKKGVWGSGRIAYKKQEVQMG